MKPARKVPFFIHNVIPLSAGCLVSFSPIALATANVLGDAKVTDIEIIKVTGQQYQRPLTLVNAGQAIISLDQIDMLQANNFAEVIDSMPGATIDGGTRSGGERINIWGFGETEDLNVYVDNAPVGFEQYRYGSFFLDPQLIKRIEVIKGAHDVRSGNGGFGGAIYASTKSADDFLAQGQSLGGQIKTTYASNNSAMGYAGTVYGRVNHVVSGLVHVTTKEAKDVELAAGERFAYSGYEQTNYLVKLDVEQGYHQLALSMTHYLDEGRKPWANRRGAMPMISDYNIKKYGSFDEALFATTSFNTYEDNTWSANYRYSPNNPLLDVQLAVSHSANARHWIRPEVAWEKMFVSVGSFGHESWLDYKRDFINLTNTSHIENHDITVGLQYKAIERRSEVFNKSYEKKEAKNFGRYAPYYQPEGEQANYAVYLSDAYSASPELTITPSIRYDYIRSQGRENLAPDYNDITAGHDYSATSHEGWSPRLGLDYQLSEHHLLSFAYAYSLMAPVVDEIYAVQYAKASVTATSPDLELERVHAIKLGLTSHFSDTVLEGDSLITQVTLFSNRGENDIGQRRGVNSDSSLPLQSNFTNLDGYQINGADFEAQYRYQDIFADLAASWLEGTHQGTLRDSQGDDEYLANIAPANVRLDLGWQVFDDLTLAWQGSWYAKQNKVPSEDLFNSEIPSDNYFVQQIYASYTPEYLMPGLTLRLALKNITNQAITPYLSDGIPAAGRDIRLSAAYRF
jgi:hemoglobin/transferrin/lactoferrin receptor protein